ncbi:DUF4349 domain-containing protein [Spirochaeta cellobiosiphila]|uniref:DUF4349 domain-containing protein n=1 Tax=Spirochaeta cellobiosiphila TaxID=504483 RepID=UPI0003F5E0C6|nr:DUF4349 domain-containing protein [Spirochaeta cellobiosiphila]
MNKFVLLMTMVVISLTSCASYEHMPVETGRQNDEIVFEQQNKLMSSLDMSKKEIVTIDQERSALQAEDLIQSNQDRKQIYNGYVKLLVDDVESIRQEAEDLTLANGGYIEQSYQTYIVLRIPVDLYDSVFLQIQGLGQLLSMSETTQDITDSFQDTKSLLETSEKTRTRLYALLEKSTDPEERAKILREIGRLTEEIENIKQRIEVMNQLASYSQITLELQPKVEPALTEEDIPFPWIKDLNPLYPVSDVLKAKVKLSLGGTWAVFDKADYFNGEDASGHSIRISSVPNEPKGDSSFWQLALQYHLSDYYKSADLGEESFGNQNIKSVTFISKDREPYLYYVGVITDKKWIHIVEYFSPTLDESGLDQFMDVLERGEIK